MRAGHVETSAAESLLSGCPGRGEARGCVASRGALHLVIVALEEFFRDLDSLGQKRLRVHLSGEVRHEYAVHHVTDGVAQVGIGVAGTDTDQGSDVEI